MALPQEILDAVTALRKETEDLVQANVRNIFKAKFGEESLVVGDNTVTFPISDDTAYLTADEYEIRIQEAYDGDGIDITNALIISNKTVSGFTVNSLRVGSLKWESFLKTPNFNFWT